MSRRRILTTLALLGTAAALAGPALADRTGPTDGPTFIGEAKNELPFTRPVEEPQTIVVRPAAGFAWRDGAIGAAAGLGLAAVMGGALAAARRSRRRRTVVLGAALAALPLVLPQMASASGTWAYVWADDATAASYTPNLGYQASSSGLALSIVRTGTGLYNVLIPGVGGGSGGTRSIVHAVAYGVDNPSRCKIYDWGSTGIDDVWVTVACFGPAGAPADSRFVASYTQPTSVGHPFALLWAGTPWLRSYTPGPDVQFSTAGRLGKVTRQGAGRYTVTLPRLATAFGTAMVTAQGAAPIDIRCKIASFVPVRRNEKVKVNCFDETGAPADTQLDLTFADHTSTLAVERPSAYVLANGGGVPNPLFSFNSSSGTNSVDWLSTGQYRVVLPGMGVFGGHVEVVAYGPGSGYCTVVRWVPEVAPHLSVYVDCYDAGGQLANGPFLLSFTA
jgi:hypothetical protein